MPVIINGSTGITNVNGSASTPAETGTDTDTGIYYGTNTVGLATNGTNALFIDASQNVGIGTTNTTDQRLKVKQSADTGASSFSFKVEANANDTGLYIGYRGAGAATAADTCAITATYGSTGAFKPITFLTSDAERMRIDSSGNVGIGTASPGARLQVTNTDGEMARFRTSSGSNQPVITISASDSAATVGFATGGNASFPAMTFANGGSERMRIDPSGNLLVGATSIPSAISSSKVYVSGAYGAQQTYGPMYYSNENNTDNVGRSSFNFYRGGTLVGQITTTNSTCAYTSVSDYRLKENIEPMAGALDKVAQLKPVTYKWKADGSNGQGFIAHELQAIVPDCVSGEKDDVNEDGSIKPQGIDTSFLVATLTAAIQEQQALITALTARIESLETK